MTYALPEWLHERRKDDPALEKVITQSESDNVEIHVMYQRVVGMLFAREEWLMMELSKHGHKFNQPEQLPVKITEIVYDDKPKANGSEPEP